MRSLALLCVVLVGYYVFVRIKSAPTPPASSTPAAKAAHSPQQASIIKRPIDRTRKALEATEKRNSEGF